MKAEDFNTKTEITWCPGCPNFGILQSTKEVLAGLITEGKIKAKDIALVSGIGCHAKIYDYINANSFYGLHGRVLPVCLGIKAANPELTVVGFGGDGDTFAEGVAHFVHSCRYNVNMTMVVHNNQVFALTTGQTTPTSEKGFSGASTPLGVKTEPLNPVALALISGASFVARGYALEINHLKKILKEAIEHKGFSFLEILQPCITYHNPIPYFQKNIQKLDENYNFSDWELALKTVREWDYSFEKDKKVPIGLFYKKERPVFEETWPQLKKPWYTLKREIDWHKISQEFK